MTPYQGRERELYTEALRTVAAIAHARSNRDLGAVQGLYDSYLRTAHEKGISTSAAWSIFVPASAVTITSLINHIAQLEHTHPAEVTVRMIAAAVEQVAADAL